MKVKLLFILSLTYISVQSQSIAVSNTQYTVPQLIQQVLFGDTSTSCFSGEITNISWSTGTNFGAANGIGYFTNTNPNFPITSGVVLSTGNALNAIGPNTSTLSDSAWPGDTDLFNYINDLNLDPTITSYNDATVLEFDFKPYVSQISFDFVFASEEYGTFQCSFSDAFAFFLTDVTAGTPAQNIALIPNTNIPISVVTIRDVAFNNSCSSQNVTYFGQYNGIPNAAASATNFNGQTVLLNANSSVTPQHTYHMKLVIADRNDSQYDSAVFLAANSFNFGISPLEGTGPYIGLNELLDVCHDQEITIQAGHYDIPNVTYSWTQDGISLPAITTSSLTVTQTGIYGVTLTGPNGCEISSDTMNIQYVAPFPISNPVDLTTTTGVFDLTENTPIILNGSNPDDYNVTYHSTSFGAHNLTDFIVNPSNYIGTDGTIVYVGIESMLTGCIEVKSFMLNPPAAPSNDRCANAVPLFIGNSFDDFPVATTNFAATNESFNEPSFCDGFYSARDIWFTVTVPVSGNVTIETQGNGGLGDTVLEAFSSCGSNISIGCNNNFEITGKTDSLYSKLELTNLTPGQNIVVRAFGKAESQGSFAIAAYDSALSNDAINTIPKVSYYPVPVKDYLTIAATAIKSIMVYNSIGQNVLTPLITPNSSTQQIDLSALQASVYFIKVIRNGETDTFKIVKN